MIRSCAMIFWMCSTSLPVRRIIQFSSARIFVSDLEKICDYVVFIQKGNVILSEEKDRLLEKYALLAMERAQYDAMPKAGVRRMLDTHGTVRVLMEREHVPHGMPLDGLGLEI